MNVRLTILLLVVLAVIGGAVGVVFGLQDKRELEEEPPWLFKIDPTAIAHISVTHMGTTVDYQDTDDGWVIKDGNDTPVDNERWPGTPLLLSGPRTSPDVVAHEITDPAEYGLAEPQTTVVVTDVAGTQVSFILGNPTPDGGQWYASLAGDNRLYTVAAIWCEVISKLASDPPYPPEEPEEGEGEDQEAEGEDQELEDPVGRRGRVLRILIRPTPYFATRLSPASSLTLGPPPAPVESEHSCPLYSLASRRTGPPGPTLYER